MLKHYPYPSTTVIKQQLSNASAPDFFKQQRQLNDNQDNNYFMHPPPSPHATEEKEDNKYNKYYAIQRGGDLKTRKTRNTNLLILEQI